MEYLTKSKERNSFKQIKDITDFKSEDFEKFDLYEIKQVTLQEFTEVVKQKQVQALLDQLKSLGVDLTANQAPQEPTETLCNNNQSSESNIIENLSPELSNALQGDAINKHQPVIPETNEGLFSTTDPMSKIKKMNGSGFFTLKEIGEFYFRFKEKIEQDVDDIAFSSFDENGILLTMVEIRNDIPKKLSNGIPIRQILQ
jgi:hypothetical protein